MQCPLRIKIIGGRMSALSGQKTVTAAGTAEALGSGQVHGAIIIKALVGNAGNVYIGNDGAGDVSSANGFELQPGEVVILDHLANLSNLVVDADNNGEGVSWIMLAA
jgi:hypothetical protein